MKTLYIMMVFSSLVVAVWYMIAVFMIYRIGEDMKLWHSCWIWIDKWLKWRYGLNV